MHEGRVPTSFSDGLSAGTRSVVAGRVASNESWSRPFSQGWSWNNVAARATRLIAVFFLRLGRPHASELGAAFAGDRFFVFTRMRHCCLLPDEERIHRHQRRAKPSKWLVPPSQAFHGPQGCSCEVVLERPLRLLLLPC